MRTLLTHPALKFLLCGGTAAAVNWFARMALSLAMPFAASVVVAYLIGMSVGFVLYRSIVWRGTRHSLKRQALGFVAVNLLTAAIVLALSLGFAALGALLSSRTELVESLAHGAAIALGAGLNYFGHSRFTFATPRKRGYRRSSDEVSAAAISP